MTAQHASATPKSPPVSRSAHQPRRSVHITVKVDPSQPSTTLPQPRMPSWLSPSTSPQFGLTVNSNNASSAASLLEHDSDSGDARTPDLRDAGKGRFRRSVDGVVRKAEIIAWRHGLWGSSFAPSRHPRPSLFSRIWTRLTALVYMFWSAFWVEDIASPLTRFRTNADTNIPVDESPSGDLARRRKNSIPSEKDANALMNALVDKPRTRLGLSRFGFIVSLVLFFLGAGELLSRSRSPSIYKISQRLTRENKRSLEALGELGLLPDLLDAQDKRQGLDDPLGLRGLWLTPLPHHTNSPFERGSATSDTTAIVLSWSRLDSLRLIVANLCRYDFFASVMIWHNNPTIPISATMFASETCPAHKIRIVQSPGNVFFVSRFLACITASTEHCFFQDDDWLIGGLRGLYAQYKRGSEGELTVATTGEMATLYGWEWCFYNPPLHSCFAWLGTGSFTSRAKVATFLDLMTSQGVPYDELALADNYFATSTNEPPYVISMTARGAGNGKVSRGGLVEIKTIHGFSNGEGLARNKEYIKKGLDRMIDLLPWDMNSPGSLISTLPTQIDMSLSLPTSMFLSAPKPPLPPHPHFFHIRASSPFDTHLFMCSPSLLPPPDSIRFPIHSSRYSSGGRKNTSLEDWESRLGWKARGWIEGGELDADGERWAGDWGYENAIDGDMRTAWRSRDVIQKGEYFGLMLISPINSNLIKSIPFHIVLEDVGEVLPHLYIEVSVDGYTWEPATKLATSSRFECRPTQHTSRIPDLTFPYSTFMSSSANKLRNTQQLVSEGLQGWLRRRRRRSLRLQDCSISLSTMIISSPHSSSTTNGISVQGWQFVRVVSSKTFTEVGWAVYEVKLGRSP